MTDLAALARFCHITAVVLFAGSHAFAEWVVRPAIRDAGGAQLTGASTLVPGFRRLTLWCLIVAIVSAIAGLWMQAITVGEGGESIAASSIAATLTTLAPLLTQTLYGNVWLGRMAIAVVLLLLLLRPDRANDNGGARDRIGLILGLCLLGSLGLSGHAAAGEGVELIIHSASDILHLLAAGAWVGALVPLGIALQRFIRIPGESGVSAVREITRRFSLLGIICVSTLVVTGAINTWILAGGVPQLVGTAYGHLLLLKLFLLLPMLGVAAINFLKVNSVIAGVAGDSRDLPGAVRVLSRNAVTEALLGLGILAIVGILGTTPPARHVQSDWPFAFRWDWVSLDTAPKARASVEVGLAWCVIGLFVLQFAFLSRRFRIFSATLGSALLVYAGTLVIANVTTDAYPATYRRPTVAYNAISVAGGKVLYEKNCLACHGALGYGDGPSGEGLNPRPADLAGRHANAHTVGDLFWWISKGVPNTAMQPFEGVLTEDDRWDLINYVRALAAAKRARALAPIIEDRPWLVAPDFAYATSTGETRTLKDFRGDRLVLLVITAGRESESRLATLGASLQRLAAAGMEIIAVPAGHRVANSLLPAVTEGNSEIQATYALFAGSFSDDPADSWPRHVEYLIDKQGYIRARWLPVESKAWSDPAAIATQAELLQKEIPREAAPEEHVH